MSWLSEWVHWLFPGDKPAPGPIQATTVVAQTVVITGKHNDALILSSDDAGVYLDLRGPDGSSVILARRLPSGEFRVHGGPNNKVVAFALTMKPDGTTTTTILPPPLPEPITPVTTS